MFNTQKLGVMQPPIGHKSSTGRETRLFLGTTLPWLSGTNVNRIITHTPLWLYTPGAS